MKKALIENNMVVEVPRVDPATIYSQAHAARFVNVPDFVSVGMQADGERGYVTPVAPLTERQAHAWERIKAERDRRKVLGVKVGAHWFHSDDSSRIQQLALMMMGAGIPPGLQWKTLTLTPPPVFVTMTQALAAGIFQATATSDAVIFAACEVHRAAMEASATPESYDFSAGWPASIEDGV